MGKKKVVHFHYAHGYSTECGLSMSNRLHITFNWEEVTCKNCLKKKSYITDISIDKAINRRLEKQAFTQKSILNRQSTNVGII